MLQTYREPGLAGSWIGQLLFGDWGPQFAGMALVPSVFGAVLLVAIFSSSRRN
ncbi:GlsB/YeaQ/YmgE family stress response membrane protein [Streptococcus suis]|nr:GlsB/YeaQ/YmgE family stress response membrane protein [Streptococcus suis]